MTRRASPQPLTPRPAGVAAALAFAATGRGDGASDATSAGDIPNTHALVVFNAGQGRYEVEAPQGIAALTSGYRPGAASAVARSAGTAVLLTYRADAAPDPVTGKVVADNIEQHGDVYSAVTVPGSSGR